MLPGEECPGGLHPEPGHGAGWRSGRKCLSLTQRCACLRVTRVSPEVIIQVPRQRCDQGKRNVPGTNGPGKCLVQRTQVGSLETPSPGLTDSASSFPTSQVQWDLMGQKFWAAVGFIKGGHPGFYREVG